MAKDPKIIAYIEDDKEKRFFGFAPTN